MVLLTFVWKCFQDRNFHGVVVGLYEQSIESWVGLATSMLVNVRSDFGLSLCFIILALECKGRNKPKWRL